MDHSDYVMIRVRKFAGDAKIAYENLRNCTSEDDEIQLVHKWSDSLKELSGVKHRAEEILQREEFKNKMRYLNKLEQAK